MANVVTKPILLDETGQAIVTALQNLSPTSIESTIAPVETSTTASQAYAVDEHFYLNNVLYKAIDDIAQGDTIVTSGVSANATSTTLVDDMGSGDASITTTTTDPGEGSTLATNSLLIVVEE